MRAGGVRLRTQTTDLLTEKKVRQGQTLEQDLSFRHINSFGVVRLPTEARQPTPPPPSPTEVRDLGVKRDVDVPSALLARHPFISTRKRLATLPTHCPPMLSTTWVLPFRKL